VNEPPWHIVPLGTVTVGFGLTETVQTAVLVQPDALLPVTV
jgi:hypothetical protein